MRSAGLACLVASASGAVVALTGSPISIIGAVAATMGVVFFRVPDIGAPIFLALLWVNVPAVLVAFHGAPSIVGEAILLFLAVPVATYLLRREPIIVTPALVTLIAFVAANLLSAATSSNTILATGAISTLIGEGLIVYLLVSNAVRTVSVARWSIAAIVVGSVVMAGLAVHQEVTKSYDDPYLGFAQNALQDEEDGVIPDRDRLVRMEGPIGQNNRFAQVLLVALPLALFGLGGRQAPGLRWLGAIAGILIVAGVFLTFSRGAAVALALLGVILVVRRYVRVSHMLAIVVAFLLTIVVVAPEFFTRVESIGAVAGWVTGEGDDPDGAIVGRTTSGIAALLVFGDHPLVGVGPGVYPSDYSVDYANRLGLRFFDEDRRAHNMYLEWGAELGLIGLGAGLAMIAVTLLQLASLRTFWLERRDDFADLAGAMSLAVIGYAATAVFLHLAYMRYFFALLALANAVIWILGQERERWERVSALPRASAPPALSGDTASR